MGISFSCKNQEKELSETLSEKIEQIFNDVKKFMEYALELNGYVLVFKY